MKKYFGRICAALACVVIVCVSAFSSLAATTAFEINELNMSIPVPDDMLIASRSSKEKDPYFQKLKVDYDKTMKELKSTNTYLRAVKSDNSLVLMVTMEETKDSKNIKDYKDISEKELTNIQEDFIKDSTVKSAAFAEYNGIKYIVITANHKTDGKTTTQTQQYNTVVNGKAINIILQSESGGTLSNTDKELLRTIISGTHITRDNFFTRHKGLFIYGGITLLGIVVVVVVFIIVRKKLSNPDRKHKILVHELAHEHRITETTQIPRKSIFNVTKPTNSFLTNYKPIEEIEKKPRKKRKSKVAADSYDEAIALSRRVDPEEEQVLELNFERKKKPVPEPEIEVSAEPEVKAVEPEADTESAVEPAAEPVSEGKTEAEQSEEIVSQTESVLEPEEEPEEKAEQEPEEMIDISQKIPIVNVQPNYDIVQDGEPEDDGEFLPSSNEQADEVSDVEFEGGEDYFDSVPDEKELYSYSDIDEAVDDYSLAHRKSKKAQADSRPENTAFDTFKKVMIAIGKGIFNVIKTILLVTWYIITHLRYFCINLYRMIKRKHNMKKRRKAEEERRRLASERRREERDLERARRQRNAARGENELVKVRSSGERRPVSRTAVQRRSNTRSTGRGGYTGNRRR